MGEPEVGPLLLGDLRSLVDAYTRLDQNYAMLGKAIEEELDAIIETSQQESTHHCQDVVSCASFLFVYAVDPLTAGC